MSVTTTCGEPKRFVDFLRSFKAALRSFHLEAKDPAPRRLDQRRATGSGSTIDLQENLVRMPPTVRICPQILDTFLTDPKRNHRPEPVSPRTDGFIAHVDAALMQQVFDITRRQREAGVQHHGRADDFGRSPEVTKWAALLRDGKLLRRPARFNQVSSDSAQSNI